MVTGAPPPPSYLHIQKLEIHEVTLRSLTLTLLRTALKASCSNPLPICVSGSSPLTGASYLLAFADAVPKAQHICQSALYHPKASSRVPLPSLHPVWSFGKRHTELRMSSRAWDDPQQWVTSHLCLSVLRQLWEPD